MEGGQENLGKKEFMVIKAEPRRVELGAGFGNRIVVKKGIRAGELVVTQGQDGLREGQDVSIVGDQS